MVHQGYLEPHAVMAQWDTTGFLTLWASTQGSFNTRSEVADVLEISENRIKVIPVECGGGFGGKIRALCEPITAVLARATGRPVRYVMTRREELEAGMPAPQVIIRLKTGVKRDGTLDGARGRDDHRVGRLLGRRPRGQRRSSWPACTSGPTFEVRGFEVLTHKPSIAAYRAPVAPQTIFAIDSHMEQIARALGVDPVEFRLRHLHARGRPHGQRAALAEQRRGRGPAPDRRASALEESRGVGGQQRQGWPRPARHGPVARRDGWAGSSRRGPRCGSTRTAPVSVLTGQVDIAGTNIALAQIAATAYGVDIDKVRITTGDTDVAPMTGLSAGSKTIYTVGVAVMEAAKDARRQTLDVAATELEASVHDLEIEDGKVFVRGVPDQVVTLAQIGKKGNLYMSKVQPVLG